MALVLTLKPGRSIRIGQPRGPQTLLYLKPGQPAVKIVLEAPKCVNIARSECLERLTEAGLEEASSHV